MSNSPSPGVEEYGALLRRVFPEASFSNDYISWLYYQSPDGKHIAADHTENGDLLGHYTVIPQQWKTQGITEPLALSLNTAVDERARGKGLFTILAQQTYEFASEQGVKAILGVANANSTPGFLRKLQFTLLQPLPVHVGGVNPLSPSRGRSYKVDAGFLASNEFDQIAASLCGSEMGKGYSQSWTPEKLRWRLSSPRTQYALHVDGSGALITTVVRHAGIPIVIALKFLRANSSTTIASAKLLRAAARYYKTIFYLYCGFNRDIALTGYSVPRRFLPSPLNLIYRRLDPSMPEAQSLELDSFEFLDFDAY